MGWGKGWKGEQEVHTLEYIDKICCASYMQYNEISTVDQASQVALVAILLQDSQLQHRFGCGTYYIEGLSKQTQS